MQYYGNSYETNFIEEFKAVSKFNTKDEAPNTFFCSELVA